jgi:Cell morphogenesis C-terminal
LMPLLRLLETDLASQALEVLEEPMTISGGPSAKHVLRMSMHINNLGNDSDSVANVFGPPEESGWSVAQPDTLREACRSNVMAVFDTCKMPLRPSRIDFEPESEILSDMLGENLGDLVQNLHELTTFFQADEHAKIHIPLPAPSHQVEARVAAILAKATTLDLVVDVPPTPFLDVFKVGVEFSDESAEESGSDSESDAFVFDSPTNHSAPPTNGARFH